MRSSLRLKHLAFSKLYRDNYRDLDRTILVAGMARSGTTWLGNIVASQGANRLVFEPFNPSPVGPLHSAHYITYKRPDDQDPELAAYCSRVFSGDIRQRWIDQHIDHLRPKGRVVKAVRANLLLGWLRRNFPEVPQVLIVRHPCAVVSSWLQLGWTAERDIEAFLEQPNLVGDVFGDKIAIVQQLRTEEERIAFVWCLNHLVPILQSNDEKPQSVFYELLITQPEIELPKLFHYIGWRSHGRVYDNLHVPSFTSKKTGEMTDGHEKLHQWQYRLSSGQVDRILSIVDAFGLAYLYGDSYSPSVESFMLRNEGK